MTRSKRFSSVFRLAETKKRDAALAAAKANQKLSEFEKQLEDLRRFRSEYALGTRAGGRILTANQLQEHQKFMRQLDAGISILQSRVKGQKQNSDLDKQVWLDAYVHSAAMDRLMGKIRKIEQDLGEAREANEADERSRYRSMNT